MASVNVLFMITGTFSGKIVDFNQNYFMFVMT